MALGAEREHRARGQRGGVERLAVGVEREQRPLAAVGSCASARRRATGTAKCSPAAPRSASGCQGSWLPVREHAGGVGGGGDAHAGAHVAEVARILEQRPRARSRRVGEHRARRRPRALRRAPSRPVDGASGASCSKTSGSTSRASARDAARPSSGASARCQALELGGVARDDLEHVRAEAQRVLERVEAFEHGERRIAPRAPEARDERSVLHAAMIAGVTAHGIECGAMKLEGIHHISAITGDARGNVEFYTGVLGLRMVKRTVNQDEPNVYHLFYGDEHGSPGMDLTFFEYPGAARGVAGAGMVHRIVWRVALARGAGVLEGAPGARGRRAPS